MHNLDENFIILFLEVRFKYDVLAWVDYAGSSEKVVDLTGVSACHESPPWTLFHNNSYKTPLNNIPENSFQYREKRAKHKTTVET